jgi:hypothetical protein
LAAGPDLGGGGQRLRRPSGARGAGGEGGVDGCEAVEEAVREWRGELAEALVRDTAATHNNDPPAWDPR